MDYGLIGAALSHSFSKQIHEQLCSYNYALHPLPTQADLDAFLRAKNFKAVNVTIPYKQAVLPYCTQVDARAAAIGAVNTLVNRGGALFGYNTDYAGFAYLAARAGVSFTGKHVMILGTGGTQHTVYAVATDAGAASVTVVSRVAEGADAASVDADAASVDANAASVGANAASVGADAASAGANAASAGTGKTTPNGAIASAAPVRAISYAAALTRTQTQVLINTTPAGMYPHSDTAALDLSGGALPQLEAVLDVVYNPLRTRLVLDAAARGIPAQGGLAMLVAQAKYAAEIFTDTPLPEPEIERILQEITQAQTNLVLIGMPGSGKTRIGKRAAALLKRPFFDLDAEIVAKAGMPIASIFEQQGEAAFRALEASLCAQLGRETGRVISTGGGTILREENVRALRQNGVLLHLERPLEALQTGNGRPLSTSADAVAQLYAQRAPLYHAAADCTAVNDASPRLVAKATVQAFQCAVSAGGIT